MGKLTRNIKYEIFKKLKEHKLLWGNKDYIDELGFLEKIWDLRSLSSSDSRYTDAYQDARQHLVMNNDWEDEYTFIDRFKLIDGTEEEYLRFINAVIAPDVRGSEENIHQAISVIEGILPNDYVIKEIDIENGLPVYSITTNAEIDNDEYPIGIPKNTIPIYVDSAPDKYPALQLNTDNWDDYGYKTTSKLYYVDEENTFHSIGVVKIIKGNTERTADVLKQTFVSLDDSFCSLGQTLDYYSRLKRWFPNNYKSILYALKDSAYYPEILQRNENLVGFKVSLTRDNCAEGALLNAKRKHERGKASDDWNFSYDAVMPYSSEPLTLQMNFGDLEDKDNAGRIKAIIGANGAGKTSALRDLVKKLIRDEEGFMPEKPIFSKVIAVSFSIFDTFIELRGKSVLTYCYCGLHNNESSIMTKEDRDKRLRNSLDWINKDYKVNSGAKSILRKFEIGLKSFFSEDFVDSLYDDDGFLNIDKISDIAKCMSSGESMILNLVACLYANIRQYSLIVFDEMEVHLHPTAIRKMMRLLFTITQQYNSACLLATHSSIVVQELLADNVQIIDKTSENLPEVRNLSHESLGENLSAINDEIFGEMSFPRHYSKFIKDCARFSNNFDELLKCISSQGLPPSLSLYIEARNIYDSIKNND